MGELSPVCICTWMKKMKTPVVTALPILKLVSVPVPARSSLARPLTGSIFQERNLRLPLASAEVVVPNDLLPGPEDRREGQDVALDVKGAVLNVLLACEYTKQSFCYDDHRDFGK